MLERVTGQQTLGNKAYQALLMAKKDGIIKGKSIPRVERILSDFENEGTGWKAKATVAESRLGEKQTTARKLESKLTEKDKLPHIGELKKEVMRVMAARAQSISDSWEESEKSGTQMDNLLYSWASQLNMMLSKRQ